MKKLLGISIMAMLAVTPMMAGATGDAPEAAGTASEPFVGVSTSNDDKAHIASTAYVKGAYNAAIGAVNTRLMNDDKSKSQIIDRKVRTTLRTTTTGSGNDVASDTALVTEKAVATALNQVASDATTTAGAGITKDNNGQISVNLTMNNTDNVSGLGFSGTGNDPRTLNVVGGDGIKVNADGVSVSLTQDAGLQLTSAGKDQPKTLGVKLDGETLATGANGLKVNYLSTGGLGLSVEDKTDGIPAGQLTIKLDGHTLATGANGLKVNYTANKGLDVAANGGTLEIKDGQGIKTSASGVEVDLKDSSSALGFDTNGKMGVVADGSSIAIDSTTNALGVKVGSTITVGANGLEVASSSLGVGNIATADKVNSSTTGYASSTALTQRGYVDEAVDTAVATLETGVVATISNSSVKIFTTWGSDNPATQGATADVAVDAPSAYTTTPSAGWTASHAGGGTQ